MRRARIVLALVAAAAAGLATTPAIAASAPCRLPGYVSTGPTRPCPRVAATGASSDFLGPVGHIFGSLGGGLANDAFRALGAAALLSAAAAVRITGALLAHTTQPALRSTWFSSAYWRVAAVSTLLTLPFLFAAAVHALVRSDLALITRAAFGYLPLALLGVSIAAPITTLGLAATDEMSAIIAGAAGDGDSSFLARAASQLTTPSLIHGDLFLAFVVAVLTVAAAIALWIELLIRGAAVDVIVLMLPLFFAAMVWPARRVWAIRAIETLVALILSKFAIVAVLALGGAALSHVVNGPAAILTGATLILLATLSPWALLRVLPLHEVAAAAAGGLSQTPRDAVRRATDHARLPSFADGPRDGDEADEGEPERAAALQRLAIASDGLGGGRSARTDADEDPLHPDMRDGARATSDVGGGSAEPSDPSGPEASPVPAPPADGRAPIERPFSGERWNEDWVINEPDARRAAPRIAGDDEGREAPGPDDVGQTPGTLTPTADPATPPPTVDPPPAVEPPRLRLASATDHGAPPPTDDDAA